MITDAVHYNIKAGNELKKTYPNLFHFTCLVHLLHNCVGKIVKHYPIVEEFFVAVKFLTIKN